MDKQTVWRIVGAGCGILLGVLMLTIGFWKAVLLGALAVVGWTLAGSTVLRDWIKALRDQVKASRRVDSDI